MLATTNASIYIRQQQLNPMKNLLIILFLSLSIVLLPSCKDEQVTPSKPSDSTENESIHEFLTWTEEGKAPVTIDSSSFYKREFQFAGSDSSFYIGYNVSGMPSNLLHLFYNTDQKWGYSLHEGEFVPDWVAGNGQFDPDSLTTFGLQTMGQWTGKISFWADRENPYDHFKIYKVNDKFVIDFKNVTLINEDHNVTGTLSGLIVWAENY